MPAVVHESILSSQDNSLGLGCTLSPPPGEAAGVAGGVDDVGVDGKGGGVPDFAGSPSVDERKALGEATALRAVSRLGISPTMDVTLDLILLYQDIVLGCL